MIYDNLSNEELIREADNQNVQGLASALAERLDMQQHKGSVFQDQAAFMQACGQTTTTENAAQANLYTNLINEELNELGAALEAGDEVEAFDAVLDSIVVLIGLGLSFGWPMEEGWAEVVRSNFAKVDPVTGMVTRREDGKILKSEGWTPPNLELILDEHKAFLNASYPGALK